MVCPILWCIWIAGPVLPVAWADNASQQANSEQKLYTCVMHPQVISDKPGNCPICGMRLVLRGTLSSEPAGVSVDGRVPVSIAETKRQELGIHTAAAEERGLSKTINAWGSLAHDPELYKLEVEYLQAARSFREQQRNRTGVAQKRSLTPREQAQIKLTDLGLSPDWIATLEEAGVPDRRLLFHHDESGIWVYLEVPQKDALLLKKGDQAVIRIVALPGTELKGQVQFIDEMVAENRTVRTRVLVLEEIPGLKAGMSVEAFIKVDLGRTLSIPETAPLFSGEKTLVFVDKDGKFEPRKVMLGRRADGYYEVKEGLVKGENVAVGGNFFIDSESRLKSGLVPGGAESGS